MSPSEPQRPNRRRPSAEVDAAILEAARAEFSRRGFAASSMRDIAAKAGAYEPMLYRRFGSKARLFDAAVLQPLGDVIADYLGTQAVFDRRGEPAPSTEDLVRSFMPPLLDLMRENRRLILALLAAEEFHGSEMLDSHHFAARIRELVGQMEEHVALEAARRPLLHLDGKRALLISFALTLGLGQLDPALSADPDDDLGGQALVDELVAFTLYGVAGRAHEPQRPGAPQPAAPGIDELFERVADAERRAVRAETELAHLKRHGTQRER